MRQGETSGRDHQRVRDIDDLDVLVAGAGPTGLALVAALQTLHPAGARIGIVDGHDPRVARTGADRRAWAISAGSVRMLEAIGAWSQCRPHAEPMLTIDITDGPLDSPIRQVMLNYANVLDDGTPGSWIVPNEVLTEALRDACDFSRVAVHAATDVTDMTVGGDFAEVRLEGMAGEARVARSLRARLVVSAQGRGASLRRRAGIDVVGWRYQQTAIVTTITLREPHSGRGTQHFLPAGPFAILPLPGRRASIVWSERSEEAERILALEPADFEEEFLRRIGPSYGHVETIERPQAFPLSLQLARELTGDRFALVGDAAHGVHPLAGQGLNLALRDVAALAELVVDALRLGLDPSGPAVLDVYGRWRRFDAVSSSLAFDAINRLFSNNHEGLRALRRFGLRAVGRLDGPMRSLVAEAAGVTGQLPRLMCAVDGTAAMTAGGGGDGRR